MNIKDFFGFRFKPSYARYFKIYNQYFEKISTPLDDNSSHEEILRAAGIASRGGKEYLALALYEAAGYRCVEDRINNREEE